MKVEISIHDDGKNTSRSHHIIVDESVRLDGVVLEGEGDCKEEAEENLKKQIDRKIALLQVIRNIIDCDGAIEVDGDGLPIDPLYREVYK